MKDRHTDGPWEVFICDDGKEWTGWPLSIEAANEDDKTVVRPGGFYPYTWDASMSQTEAVANAHLMAASPDMLTALRTALPALELAARTGDVAAVAAVALARAAIDKATKR
jgi:hypothetical protein